MSERLLALVKRTIDRHHLLNRGDRLVVGVSGGVDSMVLTYLLNSFRETFDVDLIVAHVNHGLRQGESEKEAELVRRVTEGLGLSFEYGQFDVKSFQKSRGLSPQDAARRIRFQFFNDLLRKHKAQKIALGQNADDQVETLLIRLMRGSGLRGLKGMLPFRDGKVIRPLLETWRGQIESFAAENHISYLVDSSNLKKNYLRNRIRIDLIPLIEREYQPSFKGVLLRASAILRDEDEYLDKAAEEAYRKIVHDEKEILSFRYSEFHSLHKAVQWRVVQRLLGRMIRDEEAEEEGECLDIDSIYQRLSHPPASFHQDLPLGLFIEKRYNQVSLGKGRRIPTPAFEVELDVPGKTSVQELGKEVVVEEVHKGDTLEDLKTSQDRAFLDYHCLEFPLKIRNPRPGDRFQPLGVQGTQKLKEFFIDHKVPNFERARIPVLISGERIAWVVGYRIDERFKITGKTQRILKVQVT